MEFTGERVIPGQVDPDLWNEHLARYAFAARVVQLMLGGGKTLCVLDAGCGSGYGAAHLACLGPGAQVVGVDTSEEALAYARTHYTAPNLRFERSDCQALEFAAGEFDLVVALEVIEHLAEPDAFLQQAGRILRPSGQLIVSTPNRRYYSEERGYVNPFHTREYDAAEFVALLEPCFPERVIFAQNHAAAISFFPCGGLVPSTAQAAGGAAAGFGSSPGATDEAHFLVAVCSRQKVATVQPFVFVPSSGNLLRERELHIHKLEQEIEERKRWAEQQEAELTRQGAWARGLDAELEKARQLLDSRQQELEERTDWARQLDQEREQLGGLVKELQADLENKLAWARTLEADLDNARQALANLQREFDDRTAWALGLQGETEQLREQLRAERERLEALVAERTAWAQKLESELEQVRADLRVIFGSYWYRLGKKLRLGPVPRSDRGRGSGP